MKYQKVIAGLVGCIFSVAASASLVFDSTIQLSAQGFGSANRDLTIQGNGTESGCVGVSSTRTIVVGPAGCTGDAKIDPNGIIPTGGQEVQPATDAAKFGIPTIGNLGIISASQIAILFNATEPGSNSINVTDLTLNFFTSTGVLITSIDGSRNFANSFAGNGVAGFVFVVDAKEQIDLANTVFNRTDVNSIILSLNSTLTDAAGGPESFLIFKLPTATPIQQIPEPGSLALLGIGLLGAIVVSRKRKVSNRKSA